jgi:molybdopterin synthase catalytic subunit
LDATAFLIDWLKVGAPFWKKEHLVAGADQWVEARAADDAAAERWSPR